jgi:hypothetical protein
MLQERHEACASFVLSLNACVLFIEECRRAANNVRNVWHVRRGIAERKFSRGALGRSSREGEITYVLAHVMVQPETRSPR